MKNNDAQGKIANITDNVYRSKNYRPIFYDIHYLFLESTEINKKNYLKLLRGDDDVRIN